MENVNNMELTNRSKGSAVVNVDDLQHHDKDGTQRSQGPRGITGIQALDVSTQIQNHLVRSFAS